MCLLIDVVLPDVPPTRAGEVSRAAAAAGVLELRAQRRSQGEPGARFLVGEPGEGCACSLAADDADWNAPYYALQPDAGERLARTLEFLAERAGPAGVRLRAAWAGDAADPLQAAGGAPERGSAIADARAGRIANARVYSVPATAA